MSVNIVLKSVFDDKGIKKAQKSFGDISSSIGKLGAAIGIAFSARAIVNFSKDAISAAEAARVANQRLDQIAESMQIFGSNTSQVTGRLKEFADQQMMVIGQDDELIKSTQAKLLTFKDLAATADTAGGAFDRATIAAFDLAAAGFGTAETNAVQLGKALQDPVKGLTALRRAGVTFTESEKALIQSLVDSGDQLRAQDVILKAIEKQVGGTAAATVTASQRMQLSLGEIQEEIGEALLPAFEELAPIISEVAQTLGDELRSGLERVDIRGVAQAVGQLAINFAANIDKVIKFTTVLAGVTAAVKLIQTSIIVMNVLWAASTAAVRIFAGAVEQATFKIRVLKFALISTGVGALVVGLGMLAEQFFGVEEAAYDAAAGVDAFNQANMRSGLTDTGLIPASPTGMNYPINPQPGQTYTYFNYGADGQAVWYQTTWDGKKWSKPEKMVDPAKKPSGGAKPESQFTKVRNIIKDFQQKLIAAEQEYIATKLRINKDYEDAVTQLNEDAAEKRQNIIDTSINRIRDAYRNATQLSLGDLFGGETVTQLETSVKKLTDRLTVTVSKETSKTINKSVDELISGLSARIADSKTLSENVRKLAEKGFTQTFLEQILETGVETGNVLAQSILDATPEQQAALKKNFIELEDVTETGLDTIAKQIYDKFKLATRELKAQNEIVNSELNTALDKQYQELQTSLLNAGAAFSIEVNAIKTEFEDVIDSLDNKFGGLKKTIDALLAKMAQLSGGANTDIQAALIDPKSGTQVAGSTIATNVAAKSVTNSIGLIIDSVSDIAPTMDYLQQRIAAANKYIKSSSITEAQKASATDTLTKLQSGLTTLKGATATETGGVGTVINNITVKVDTKASEAMVGKTLGKLVTTYSQTGGKVLVSSQK